MEYSALTGIVDSGLAAWLGHDGFQSLWKMQVQVKLKVQMRI